MLTALLLFWNALLSPATMQGGEVKTGYLVRVEHAYAGPDAPGSQDAPDPTGRGIVYYISGGRSKPAFYWLPEAAGSEWIRKGLTSNSDGDKVETVVQGMGAEHIFVGENDKVTAGCFEHGDAQHYYQSEGSPANSHPAMKLDDLPGYLYMHSMWVQGADTTRLGICKVTANVSVCNDFRLVTSSPNQNKSIMMVWELFSVELPHN